MLREIHIDKYNKIISQFKPEVFSSLTILQAKPYNQTVEFYTAYDENQSNYQIYNTEKDIEPILADLPFIETSPKILLIKTEKDCIIVEEQFDSNLYEFLLVSESKPAPTPFLEEIAARQLMSNLQECLENYQKHNVNYNAINPKNIVRRGMVWELSVAGLLLRNQRESPDYYKTDVKKEFKLTYALGTLLFKLLFGFVPFEKKKESIKFSFNDYLKYLDKEQSKKSLKTYYFVERMLQVSDKAKKLIELALKGDLTFEAFFSNEYFTIGAFLGNKKELNPAAKQIKMMSIFNQSYQSQIMAAIEHRKKYPQQKLHSKLIYWQELSKQEIISHLRKHPILCEVNFDESFSRDKIKQSLREAPEDILPVDLEYFNREDPFDSQYDFPCRDLIKIIQNYRNSDQYNDSTFEQTEARIKLYAFPYAIAFELLKVGIGQTPQIHKKINRIIDDLMQVSQLNFTKAIQPLHKTTLQIKSFEDIKIRFREQLNDLYKHFMNEAMKKYNVKKEGMSYIERSKTKEEGLNYYRLCLKLMECSLLIRKKGKDLDLTRIETSNRKEIQNDLNQLLKQYFPNKIELN